MEPSVDFTISSSKSVTSKSEKTFELLIENSDSLYKPKYQNLEKYRFRFKDKKWEYKNIEKSPNAKDGFTAFYNENLDDIINANPSINFDKAKKEEFLKNLEEVSGHKVVSKEINKKETEKKEVVKEKTPTKKNTGQKISKDSKTKNGPVDPTDKVGKNGEV